MPGMNTAETVLEVLHEKDVWSFALSSEKRKPFSDYEWALDLQEITHKISLGETYRNDRADRNNLFRISTLNILLHAYTILLYSFLNCSCDSICHYKMR